MKKKMKKKRWNYDVIKRIIDITISGLALIILIPLFLVVAILIKVESAGRVIFPQDRVGKDGEIFRMYKFRSMVANAEELKRKLILENEATGPMFKIKNDPRITTIGRFLRRTSIDELPQLFNVLKGDMSLVGPRPSLPEEVEKFDLWMLRRLDVKPGLTCYWQVMGRNSIGFEEWMKLDVKYVNERTLWIDIKLIFKTFSVLLGDNNAY